jgi:hypothetical protein
MLFPSQLLSPPAQRMHVCCREIPITGEATIRTLRTLRDNHHRLFLTTHPTLVLDWDSFVKIAVRLANLLVDELATPTVGLAAICQPAILILNNTTYPQKRQVQIFET